MSNSEYKDSYEESPKFWLPEFLGSVYEHQAGDFAVLDVSTGEQLSRKYLISFVDTKKGYFVEEKKTQQGIRFVAHYNPNLQIIKTEEFYEKTEE